MNLFLRWENEKFLEYMQASTVVLAVIQCPVIITLNTADKHLFSERGFLVSFV
jgi:hypothetical protein